MKPQQLQQEPSQINKGKADPFVRGLKLASLFPGKTNLRANRLLSAIQLRQHEEAVRGDAISFWTSPLVPSEILNAFGIHSTTPETLAAVLTSMGLGDELLDEADSVLHLSGTCSFQRCALGALNKGYAPLPQAFVAANTICDDTPLMCAYLGAKHKKEYFLIDVPQENSVEAVEYVASQLSALIEFCSDISGRKLSSEALCAAIRHSNNARRCWLRANLLRKTSPPLLYGVSSLRMAGGMLLQKFGLRDATDVLNEFVLELEEKINQSADPISCRRRILWLHLFPLFDREFMRYVEEALGLVVVFEESSHMWWEELDEQKPLKSLARKILSNPYLGGVERRCELISGFIKEYSIDGVVHFSHLGCRALSGGVSAIRDFMQEQGTPFLELSGDCNDNRNYSFEQYRTRLDAFCEIMD